MIASLRKPEDIERAASNLQDFMQTLRARALRVDRIRQALATLNDDERFGLAAEMLGCTEDELNRLLLSGARAITSEPGASGEGAP